MTPATPLIWDDLASVHLKQHVLAERAIHNLTQEYESEMSRLHSIPTDTAIRISDLRTRYRERLDRWREHSDFEYDTGRFARFMRDLSTKDAPTRFENDPHVPDAKQLRAIGIVAAAEDDKSLSPTQKEHFVLGAEDILPQVSRSPKDEHLKVVASQFPTIQPILSKVPELPVALRIGLATLIGHSGRYSRKASISSTRIGVIGRQTTIRDEMPLARANNLRCLRAILRQVSMEQG